MDILKTLQGLLGVSEAGKLASLITLCELDFKSYCNRDDVPSAADGVILAMVQQRYNRLGAEGLNSQSFNGVNENYINGYDTATVSLLNKFRKIRLL